MPRRLAAALRLVAVLAALPAGAAGIAAQQPPPRAPLPADTVPGDTVPGDTVPADSAARREPPPDPVADAIIRQLRELQGYTATEYLAEGATYRADEGELHLRGQAQVERGGDRLLADTIIYNQRTDLVEARGSPQVTGQQQELTGEVLYYDLARKRATVRNARTKVSEGAVWYVTSAVATAQGSDRLFASHGRFTTCDLEIPHYHFESDQIKVVNDKYLVARPARLYFGKVPVMILPFVVQSLEEGRRSGFLVPRFSFTDIVRNSGHTREISDIGWYWAISEYLGAQVTGTWRSAAYTQLTGNVDYRWRRRFLQGSFGFSRYWRNEGSREFAVDGNTSWRPDERTNLSGSGRFMTSTSFLRQTTFDPMEARQDLNSSFNLSRRFDWGTTSLGMTATQAVASGELRYTLPSFAIAPNPVTFFRAADPALASWYNNATLTWGLTGSRTGSSGTSNFAQRRQDRQTTNLQGGISSLTFGKLGLSATGQLNQTVLNQVIGVDSVGNEIGFIPGGNNDMGSWQASMSYQQDLIGQTTLSPTVGFSQEIRRDSLTGNEYLNGPMRMNFGAGLSTAIFGFYPGVGPFSAIRHRLTPQVSYSFSPAVQQNERQIRAWGRNEGLTQNIVTIGVNQTWEAKLKRPTAPAPADTASGAGTAADSLARQTAVPAEPEKVTLLSLNTSSVGYDFTQAAATGNGFTNSTISNSITSDYLRGLTVQVTHDLFDRSDVNPNDPAQRGESGRFAPRLSQLSTGFDIGPNFALFRWLGLGPNETRATQGTMPGTPEGDPATTPSGASASTGNPQSFGGGNWRMGVQYAFQRPTRSYDPNGILDDRAQQTFDLTTAFPLTENWGVDWATSYSVTDAQFAGHRLNFKRNLHRWQANFSFYQTATGNTAFQFFVSLIDNPDLKFDYRESNLGIDRRR